MTYLAGLLESPPHRLDEGPTPGAAPTPGAVPTAIHLGYSEGGRPITGFRLGNGPLKASLMAGAHADEPVGPATLNRLVREAAGAPRKFERLLADWTLFIVPHVNPDGEAANRAWVQQWPSVKAYLEGAVREPPGRDVEFAWPDRRPENRVIARWLRDQAPFALHASLHGMGFSDGALLLIERNWTYRTENLQEAFRNASLQEGLEMHDHNRKGEKGFFYVGPGFSTTPEGAAMRAYFESRGEPDMAAHFGESSMEFIRSLGGDPLCIVTELPLFLVPGASDSGASDTRASDSGRSAGVPTNLLAFREILPGIRARLAHGEDVSADLAQLCPLELSTAFRLQVTALDAAMMTIRHR